MLRILTLTRKLQPLTGPLACRLAVTLSPCSSRGCLSATAAAVPARPSAKPWRLLHPHLARPYSSSTATAANFRRAEAAARTSPARLLCGSSAIPQQRLRPAWSSRTDSSPELQQPGGAGRGGSSYSSRAFPQQARQVWDAGMCGDLCSCQARQLGWAWVDAAANADASGMLGCACVVAMACMLSGS